jgi:hypothetical protein
MIEFATFFLGLVLGIHRVEVVAAPQVARVDFVLDGKSAAEVRQAPWRTSVDLGPTLAPHELVAIAFDEKGREIGRVRQWLNLARPPAEAAIVLMGGVNGKGRRAHVSWEAAARAAPRDWTVTLDGRVLAVPDPKAFDLPPCAADQVHVLRVELDFDQGVSTVAEVVFGAGNRDATGSELTAALVRLEPGKRMPPVVALDGVFSDGAERLHVVAVEEGPADVLFVVDGSARFDLDHLQTGGLLNRRGRFALRKQDRLRIVWPDPEERQRPGGPTYQVFPMSGDLTPASGGVLWQLTAVRRAPAVARQRLAEAVGVAAVSATARNLRRAVVLILGSEPDDQSDFEADEARRFLERLGVPLLVWSVAPAGTGLRVESWGEIVDVSTLARFGKAVEQLGSLLERERIVWVEGRHLPQNISVAARPEFAPLAGSPAGPGASPSRQGDALPP